MEDHDVTKIDRDQSGMRDNSKISNSNILNDNDFGANRPNKDFKNSDEQTMDFLSTVAHELRTPLAISNEAISLIMDGVAGSLTQQQEKLISIAHNNIRRLKKISEDLFDIARAQSGRLSLRYSLSDMRDLLLDSADYFGKIARDEGISLRYNLVETPVKVFMDSDRISQVINNLIGNAIKFTKHKGTVTIELKIVEDRVVVCVEDTGIGIAQENIPKLFDKFFQVSKTPNKGLGIGLSVVKEILGLHNGGKVWVESSLGVGSRFFFSLPKFFTTNPIDKNMLDDINNFLHRGGNVYVLNVDFESQMLKTSDEKLPAVLNEHLVGIKNDVIKTLDSQCRQTPKIFLHKRKIDQYSLFVMDLEEGYFPLVRSKIEDKVKKMSLESLDMQVNNFTIQDFKYPVF